MQRNEHSAFSGDDADFLFACPLTSQELHKGVALRVVRCTRSSEGRFEDGPVSYLWSVLVYARPGKKAGKPRCLAIKGDSKLPSGVVRMRGRLLSSCELALDYGVATTPWKIDEYAFCVPAGFHRMVFLLGAQSVALGGGLSGEMVGEYGRRIANACVDACYPQWLEACREELVSRAVPSAGPLMSIVMPVYKTPRAFLRRAIQSVLGQTYENWELVVVNASPEDAGVAGVLEELVDARIKIISCEENYGIAGNTNVGIEHCSGDYVSFFDHDDLLEPYALAEYVRVIKDANGSVDLLYCDEDNVDEEDVPLLPLFKPGYNPDFLLSNNYVIHWLTICRDILGKLELPGKDVDGAQDYDLTFKAVEAGAKVVHVPHVLYHWRIHSGSTASNPNEKSYTQNAGLTAIRKHLERTGAVATAKRGPAAFTYEVCFSVPSSAPDLLVCSPEGISAATGEALRRYAETRKARVSHASARLSEVLADDEAAGNAFVLVLTPRHDIDLESLEWLVGIVSRSDVFAASPRVIRDDGLLDYAGAIVAPDGQLVRMLRYLPEPDGGYVGRAQRPYDAFVLNVECCLLKPRALEGHGFEEAYRFDEYVLAEATAAAYTNGLRNVYLPYATARLNAPRSLLGLGEGGASEDATLFAARHPEVADGDPSHNPNFDLRGIYYALRDEADGSRLEG